MAHGPNSVNPKRSGWYPVLAWLERCLIVCGVVGISLYAAACASATATQHAARSAFERQLDARLRAETHDLSEWDATRVARFEAALDHPVSPLARLEIPEAGVSVMVLEGTDDWTLNRAVGRIEGTADIDVQGNLGIAGHRDGIFRGLRHLQLGDALTLTSLQGIHRYEVESLRVVRPSDVEVLDPTPHASLTLVTCYPFYFVGDAPERFIVHARRVGFRAHAPQAAPHLAAR